MEVNNTPFEFGIADDGYGILSSPKDISVTDLSELTQFCKSVKWTPKKIDYPGEICHALLPLSNKLAALTISQADNDSFGRGLTLSIKGSIIDNSPVATASTFPRLADQLPDASEYPLKSQKVIDTHCLLNISSEKKGSSKVNYGAIHTSSSEKTQTQHSVINRPSRSKFVKSTKSYMSAVSTIALTSIFTLTVTYFVSITPLTNEKEANYNKLVESEKKAVELQKSKDDWQKVASGHKSTINDWKQAASSIAEEDIIEPNQLEQYIQNLKDKRLQELSEEERKLAEKSELLPKFIQTLENMLKELKELKIN